MRSFICSALMLIAAASLAAHHTAAYVYDVEKPVPLKGVVTEVEWKNPHGSHTAGLEAIDLPSGTKFVGECVRPR